MKLTIVHDEIFQDGVRVGHLAGRPEVYVYIIAGEFKAVPVARFKRYLRKETAKTLAKNWVKFVFSRMAAKDILEKLEPADYTKRVSPMQLAWDLGMPKETPKSSGDGESKLF